MQMEHSYQELHLIRNLKQPDIGKGVARIKDKPFP